MDDDEEIRIAAVNEMLRSGYYFITSLSYPLHLSPENPGSTQDSGPAAKFQFYFEEMRPLIVELIEEWNQLHAEIKTNPEKRTLLFPLIERQQWKQRVRSAYHASTEVLAVLREAVDKCKHEHMEKDEMTDAEAEATAKKEYPHLGLLLDFRKKAESYLGISRSRAAG